MNNDKLNDFKNAMRLYHYHQNEIGRLKELIIVMYCRLDTLQQVRIGEPIGENRKTTIELIEQRDQYKQELLIHQKRVSWVNDVLKTLDPETKSILKKIYIDKTHTYKSLATTLYYDERHLKRLVNKKICHSDRF